MAIKDIQRRGHQIGEIRLGKRVEKKGGGFRPAKLEAFRFTTPSRQIADAVAQLLGGQVADGQLASGKRTFDVETSATELPVMLPPGALAISQFYEMWTAAGCARRCDGEIEQRSQEPCKCPLDPEKRSELAKEGSACKPITRLNVMLPDLPDLGVWLLSSTGWNAAVELGGAAEVLAGAREQGVIIPATLRLEQRDKKVPGQPTKNFVVPVLEINASLRQMVALTPGGGIAESLPAPPPQAQAALGTGAVQAVDLSSEVRAAFPTPSAREAFKPLWTQRFGFTTTAVPAADVEAARGFIQACANPDNEPIEAELVTNGEPF